MSLTLPLQGNMQEAHAENQESDMMEGGQARAYAFQVPGFFQILPDQQRKTPLKCPGSQALESGDRRFKTTCTTLAPRACKARREQVL